MKKTLLVITGLFLGFSLLAQNAAREIEASINSNAKFTNEKAAFYFEGFEESPDAGNGVLPTGWVQKRTTALDEDPTTDAESPMWFRQENGVYGFDDPDGDYVRTGVGSLAVGYTAPEFTWAISPEIPIPTPEEGSTFLEFWVWYANNGGSGPYPSSYYVNVFADGAWTNALSTVGPTEPENNFYETPVEIDLTAYHGKTIQIAFIYEFTDGYQMAVDDVTIYNSDPVGVSTNQFDNLAAYPNPFTDKISVNNAKVERVVIYNLIGQEVMNARVNGNTVDTSELLGGVYVVSFEGDGERVIRKMIKQ
ncbi:MAG: T9SS type A sorting domain-containing protein [Bacteroidales bacterium]|nr:T9SS type A sorting domain-containing protein [Bacteroidales bacterium]MDY0349575.1 T9SS type A sorting domain-containing protein [Tenuifilaceae bacterium]